MAAAITIRLSSSSDRRCPINVFPPIRRPPLLVGSASRHISGNLSFPSPSFSLCWSYSFSLSVSTLRLFLSVPRTHSLSTLSPSSSLSVTLLLCLSSLSLTQSVFKINLLDRRCCEYSAAGSLLLWLLPRQLMLLSVFGSCCYCYCSWGWLLMLHLLTEVSMCTDLGTKRINMLDWCWK